MWQLIRFIFFYSFIPLNVFYSSFMYLFNFKTSFHQIDCNLYFYDTWIWFFQSEGSYGFILPCQILLHYDLIALILYWSIIIFFELYSYFSCDQFSLYWFWILIIIYLLILYWCDLKSFTYYLIVIDDANYMRTLANEMTEMRIL